MKRILPLLILVLVGFNVLDAQVGFEVSPTLVEVQFDASETDVVGKAEVCNTSNDTIMIFWSITDCGVPAGWSNYFCDKNLCYGPMTQACPPTNPVVLAPGDCGNMDHHINPNGDTFCGCYNVKVWMAGDTSNNTTIQYKYNCGVSSSNDLALSNFKVYPNPATNFFKTTEVITNARITVSNLIGKEVLNYDMQPHTNYPLGSVPQGMYLVNIIGENGDLLKTVRLRKL